MTVPECVGAVLNPTSGSGTAVERVRWMKSIWSSPDWRTHRLGAGLPLEGLDSFVDDLDLLVIVGGDGTVGKVASTLYLEVDDPPPVCIVPTGRGNSAYQHYYGDRPWRELIKGLSRGMRTGPLDLGRVRCAVEAPARCFVLGVSAGLFCHSLRAADRLSWLPGLMAYSLGSTYAGVMQSPVPIVLEDADRRRLFEGQVMLAAVGGGRYRARRYELFPGSQPGRSHLDCLVIEPRSLVSLLQLSVALRTGKHLEQDGVHRFRSREFRMVSSGSLPAEIDGTVFDKAVREITMKARPGALRMAYPQNSFESDPHRERS